MKYQLPSLPYPDNALEPAISAETIKFHYGKHAKAYMDNFNKLIIGTKFENEPIEYVIKNSNGAIFNNAAQTWNHLFYFKQFTGRRGSAPYGHIKKGIERSFGSINEFKNIFSATAVSLFGSGWVWLIANAKGELTIDKGANAFNPIILGHTPILTFDVWEHAYYLDYQNRRDNHVSSLWDIIDWDIIEDRYKQI